MDATRARAAVSAVVEEVMTAHPEVPGVCVAVHLPDGRMVDVARGTADPATGEPLTALHASRIASCTKPFVASTVLQLEGRGSLDIDQPVIGFLPDDVAELFARFEHGRVATVRHLLLHRSGLVDHSTFPEFNTSTLDEWTPRSQISIAVGKPALFAPDEAFSYSDSGYVLLGQVVEHLTGRSLGTAVRHELGLDPTVYPSIFWEVMEPAPAGLVRAHQLHDGDDTYGWNPSLDLFGGGGIVATMPDLARWWTDLFAGRVHPHLARQLADPRPSQGPDGVAMPGNDMVGLGLFRRTVAGHDVWAHGGYWGLQTLHVPSVGFSMALVITHRTSTVPGPGAVADRVIGALLADG
jgi:D-alanyl-D-alanine carboxypeptidase